MMAACDSQTCFVCSRCEYPICTFSDILRSALSTTENAFHYMLEDLLSGCEEAVPCYSRGEAVSLRTVVSPSLLELPLTAKAKVHALKVVHQSERAQGKTSEELSLMSQLVAEEEQKMNQQRLGVDAAAPLLSQTDMDDIPSYTTVKTFDRRVDILCVKETVIGGGVALCTSSALSASNLLSPSTDVFDEPFNEAEEAPSSFSVSESFVRVDYSASSSTKPWFQCFRCVSRAECPECHLALGYLFEHREMGCAPFPSTEQPESPSDEPLRFVGIELKCVKEGQWSVSKFHERYVKAKNVVSFREQFPHAEELQRFQGRLSALHVEGELYHNLLNKHKEQHDVQSALLKTQKCRIDAYDERVKALQDLVASQRSQILAQVERLLTQGEFIQKQFEKIQLQEEEIQKNRMALVEREHTMSILREEVAALRGNQTEQELPCERKTVSPLKLPIDGTQMKDPKKIPPAHLCGIYSNCGS